MGCPVTKTAKRAENCIPHLDELIRYIMGQRSIEFPTATNREIDLLVKARKVCSSLAAKSSRG